MRQLLALVALSVALAAAPSVRAAPIAPTDNHTVVQKSTSSTSTSTSKSKKKNTKDSGSKKKKSTKDSSSGSATLDSIASVKHGKSGVEITASVSKADLTCDLKLRYANGSTDSPDSVTSDKDKVCSFSVDIPDDSDVAGTAAAELTLHDSNGKKLASDKKDFTIK